MVTCGASKSVKCVRHMQSSVRRHAQQSVRYDGRPSCTTVRHYNTNLLLLLLRWPRKREATVLLSRTHPRHSHKTDYYTETTLNKTELKETKLNYKA